MQKDEMLQFFMHDLIMFDWKPKNLHVTGSVPFKYKLCLTD